MAITTTELERAFRYNSVDLPDPGPDISVEDVRELYSATYPEILNATIEGPEDKDGTLLYTFRRAVGTKGAEFVDGASLIAKERTRQILEEGYDAARDDEYIDHSLALAACAYAAPVPLYLHLNFGDEHRFTDVWPDSWARAYDKRPRDDEGLLPACAQEIDDRLRCLVKAGALVAAEIDRLLREKARTPT